MRNKKHIDRIFQEKLKDFEATPSPKVWKNIKNELDQEGRSKKLYPLWMRLAGIAALLLILFSIGNLVISDQNDPTGVDSQIVDTEDTNSETVTPKIPLNDPVNSVVNELSNEEPNDTEALDSSFDASDNALANTNDIDPTTKSEKSNSLRHDSDKTSKSYSNKNEPALVQQSNLKNGASEKESFKNTANSVVTNEGSDTRRVEDSEFEDNSDKDARSSSFGNDRRITDSTDGLPNQIDGIENGVVNKEDRLNGSNLMENTDSLENGNLNTIAMNPSPVDENKDAEEEGISEPENQELRSIEEEIAQAEDIIEKEEEKKVDRWQVYANVAPVYYNTLGTGSHIDDQFVENSKSGEVNMSYGVNVSYALNNKLKLRTGVNTLDLSYDTDNVILYETVGVNYNGTPRNITLNSTGQSFTAISANNLGAQQLSDLVGGDNNAAISQRIAYYEVPLELEYSLVNSRFGLNIFGGFSTFFLEDNQVFSEFDGYKTEVGEANNINSVSFSGNIGLGLDYKFSDKILFNILPTFKYQLNAYKNTSGNFRPYIVGLYTGLSYKF